MLIKLQKNNYTYRITYQLFIVYLLAFNQNMCIMPINRLISLSLVNQSDVAIVLIITVISFGILLVYGVYKSHKLKKENERLEAMSYKANDIDNEDKPYRDFTESHSYSQNN